MARSLGLAAYRAMARRSDARFATPSRSRPDGELVWIHAGEAENLLAVRDLAKRLVGSRQNLHVLITVEAGNIVGAKTDEPEDGPLIIAETPSEHPNAIKVFWDHWHPDLCIWVWGMLRPNLNFETAERGCPSFLIDADEAGFDHRRDRWLPDLTRQLLETFDSVFARSAPSFRRLIALGSKRDSTFQASALMAGGKALECVESDLSEISAALGGRPAWFATQVLPTELAIVLAAHKQALRMSHRLLLILQPSSPDDAQAAADMAAEQELSAVHWDNGQFPDDLNQVMISSDSADRGLFYRVAPVSFLGATLVPDAAGCDPLDAAALGSAVLYGPKVRDHMPSYSRLAAAGAARIVIDVNTLGTAISRLIAPDQAATMAHAGWDVISQGAELSDRVVDLVRDTLDEKASRS